MLFIEFCIFVCVFAEESFCKFKIGALDFDLTGIKTPLEIDLTSCGEMYHTFIFDLCQNLPSDDCPSTNTQGPSNACDAYQEEAYYWIGSPNISYVTFPTEYESEQYTIKFSGIPQEMVQPTWTRNFDLTCVCEPKQETPQLVCTGLQQGQSSTLYKMKMTSKDACPISHSPSTGFWDVQYEDQTCNEEGRQVAFYYNAECFDIPSTFQLGYKSMDFYCTSEGAYIQEFDNSDTCYGSPTVSQEIGRIGDCFEEETSYHKVFCTENYQPDYSYAKYFFGMNVSDPEFSPQNPVIGKMYMPVHSQCEKSLTNPDYYTHSTCATTGARLDVSLFSDPGCSRTVEYDAIFPGQVVDMSNYVAGDEGVRKYMMFVDCV